MLSELSIENLGVIARIDLEFGDGLTALTGETGAGKTMLVEAIELVVGGRADATVVRSGADEARIDARFVRPDGAETVLTRVIPVEGRSRAYVDGRPATAATLTERARGLVDLHGQHAHQRLLSTATQRAALDEFGSIDLGPLQAARGRVTELDATLATLGGDGRSRAREVDLLEYQVGELDAAAIEDATEDDRLDEEESLLGDAAAHRAAASTALDALGGDDGGARDLLASALGVLDGRSPFAALAVRLRDQLAEIDDIATELRACVDDIAESPERLDEVRTRRQLLRDLRRKYGDTLDEVIAFHHAAERRLDELRRFDATAAELDVLRTAAIAEVRREAETVGRRRREVAPQLASAVEVVLRDLAMPSAAIAISVGTHADDHPGDHVEFLLAANPGLPMLPLNRVASGGELARAMLALRLVLSTATEQHGDTLVFDEVDAGIGGAAAVAVADALARLGRHHQVLVVTHLAQVAARATTQVTVTKRVVDGRTYATAHRLADDDRVDEVARMLSGDVTDVARDHARGLLGDR
jgi:DNA repair protein RecN (Recombination protein N)